MAYLLNQDEILENYRTVRAHTETICEPLAIEDYVPQPMMDVSPPKWHLAHTTWFFEQFVLVQHWPGYGIYDADFAYLFNSYYNNMGERTLRQNRGFITRPTVHEVYDYRASIDDAMELFFDQELSQEILQLIEIGLNHEQQHQELLAYDIKFILGTQPTFPALGALFVPENETQKQTWIAVRGGEKSIGAKGDAFCFDNELPAHKVLVQDFEISNRLVTNAEYVAFMDAGGYRDFNLWHAEGWDFIHREKIEAPLYWHIIDGQWHSYTFAGLKPINPNAPVMHISFYEAFAYAEWAGCRLPTEFEWEAASHLFGWGKLWEWTASAYLPYPGFTKAPGALGEYNGKFMLNQNVLRGASVATPAGHARPTYRNFFNAGSRWIFSGLRLAKSF
jgi:ergothioneine biosynthesis protein EgtB